jgi:hypothetical protein
MVDLLDVLDVLFDIGICCVLVYMFFHGLILLIAAIWWFIEEVIDSMNDNI